MTFQKINQKIKKKKANNIVNIIYIVDISEFHDCPEKEKHAWIDDAMQRVSDDRRIKADVIKLEDEKIKSLISGLLIQYAWNEYSHDKLPEILTGNHGKPYFKDGGLAFSLSHSGDFVCLAVSEYSVGCDIQKYVRVHVDIAGRFFHEEEKQVLEETMESHEYEQIFFDLWSLKESYIKYTGQGMSQGLDTFSMVPALSGKCDDSSGFTAIVYDDIDGYSLSTVCASTDRFGIKRLDVNQL